MTQKQAPKKPKAGLPLHKLIATGGKPSSQRKPVIKTKSK